MTRMNRVRISDAQEHSQENLVSLKSASTIRSQTKFLKRIGNQERS